MRVLNKIAVLTNLLYLTACASVTPPTGGPKDIKAPVLKLSSPGQHSTNFNGNKLILEFDEEIQTRNLQTELLITPLGDLTYKEKVDRKKLEITFTKSLQPNTTYTFNFRKGIQDLTESNSAKVEPVVFSTGNYIDSGNVKGNVLDHLTKKPEINAVVALYTTADTNSIRKGKPYYTTQTDSSGNFAFKNIKESNYKLFALVEKNNNLLFDEPGEKIGYLLEPINITAKTEPVNITTTHIDITKPKLQSRKVNHGLIQLEFNEGLEKYSIQNTDNQKDTLKYWSNSPKIISILKPQNHKQINLVSAVTDSAGFITTDTISVAFGNQNKPDKIIVDNALPTTLIRNRTIQLRSNYPILQVLPQKISILKDSSILLILRLEEIKANSASINISVPNIVKEAFTLRIDSAAFTTYNNQTNNTTQITYELASEQNSGNVSGTIKTNYSNFILQLLDQQYKVIEEHYNQSNFTYKSLSPGAYWLRVINDRNQNHKWDGGTIEFNKMPEEVYLYSKPIEVKPNWDIEDIHIEVQ